MSDDEIQIRISNFLHRALASTLCDCGRVKKIGMSFCSRCYGKLPRPNRHALYNKIGEGYFEAYIGAMGRLGIKMPEPLEKLMHELYPGAEPEALPLPVAQTLKEKYDLNAEDCDWKKYDHTEYEILADYYEGILKGE